MKTGFSGSINYKKQQLSVVASVRCSERKTSLNARYIIA